MGIARWQLIWLAMVVAAGGDHCGVHNGRQREERAALRIIARRSVRFTTKIYDTFRDFNSMVASPLSAETLLVLLYLGSTNQTARDVAAALDIPLNRRTCRLGYRALASILARDGSRPMVDMGTRVFVDRNYPTVAGFLDGVTEDFLATTRLVDFKRVPGEVVRAVNRWTGRRTRRRIDELVDQATLTQWTRVLFVNTLFFDGRWQSPFNPGDMRNGTFHVSARKKRPVRLMHQVACFNYSRLGCLEATALELPFKGHRASMVVLLPDSKHGLYTMENKLQEVGFGKIRCSNRGRVSLYLPRFELDQVINYNGHIRQLHIHDIFNSVLVSGVAKPRGNLKVTDVVQNTYVHVDEMGTIAATATAEPGKSNCCEKAFTVYQKTKVLVIRNRMLMEPAAGPLLFKANHPFVFFVRDKKTDSILFVGRYLSP